MQIPSITKKKPFLIQSSAPSSHGKIPACSLLKSWLWLRAFSVRTSTQVSNSCRRRHGHNRCNSRAKQGSDLASPFPDQFCLCWTGVIIDKPQRALQISLKTEEIWQASCGCVASSWCSGTWGRGEDSFHCPFFPLSEALGRPYPAFLPVSKSRGLSCVSISLADLKWWSPHQRCVLGEHWDCQCYSC